MKAAQIVVKIEGPECRPRGREIADEPRRRSGLDRIAAPGSRTHPDAWRSRIAALSGPQRPRKPAGGGADWGESRRTGL